MFCTRKVKVDRKKWDGPRDLLLLTIAQKVSHLQRSLIYNIEICQAMVHFTHFVVLWGLLVLYLSFFGIADRRGYYEVPNFS